MDKKSLFIGGLIGFVIGAVIISGFSNTKLFQGKLGQFDSQVCKVSNCDVSKKIDDFLNRYAQDWEFTNTRDARIEETLNNFFNRYAQDFEWMQDRH